MFCGAFSFAPFSYISDERNFEVSEFFQEFKRVMFENNRFDFIIDGLVNTFLITLGSLLLGIALGVIVAIIRSTYDKNYTHFKKKGGYYRSIELSKEFNLYRQEFCGCKYSKR